MDDFIVDDLKEEKRSKNGKQNIAKVDDELYNFWELSIVKIATVCPDFEKIIDTLIKTKSLSQVKKICCLSPLTPCKPMLAKPLKEIGAIFTRLENRNFTCEFKYDGLRG